MFRSIAAGCVVVSVAHVPDAGASDYPTRSLRMVVNAAPGGANDILGRLVAQAVSADVAQQVIVDNRGGAGGNVGAEIVAHATPDGYTFLYCTSSVVVSPSLYPRLTYKLSELAPITLAARFPIVLATHPSLPAKDLKEMIALSRARGGLNYGSTGTGSVNHLTGALLDNLAGIRNVHIGYKGAGPMMTALLSNEVEMGIATVFSAAPHVKAGRLRALAVTSANPVSALPGVPPLAATYPGFETSLWHGYFGTAGTPPARIALLNAQVVKALRSPLLQERIAAGGGEVAAISVEQFAAIVQTDHEKYAKLVKLSGATPN